MLQKDDPKIGPKKSPKNGLVVQGSHGPMFQTSFYPMLSTKRLVAKSILVPIFYIIDIVLSYAVSKKGFKLSSRITFWNLHVQKAAI